MELVYSFATLVTLDGMNGVIAQYPNHESQTNALKMEAVYCFEFKAYAFSNIKYNYPQIGSSYAANSS